MDISHLTDIPHLMKGLVAAIALAAFLAPLIYRRHPDSSRCQRRKARLFAKTRSGGQYANDVAKNTVYQVPRPKIGFVSRMSRHW